MADEPDVALHSLRLNTGLKTRHLAGHDGANRRARREEKVDHPELPGAIVVGKLYAVAIEKRKRRNRVPLRPQHGQGREVGERLSSLFLGVGRLVHFFLEQGNVFHGVLDGIFRSRVVHTAQIAFAVHQPKRGNVVGVRRVPLDHERLRNDGIDVGLLAGEELPFSVKTVVARVALDILGQYFGCVVLSVQREAHGGDVALVAVPKVGPEQLLGHLRHVRRIGRKEGRQPHLAVERSGIKWLAKVIGQRERLHPLNAFAECFGGAVLGEVREGVEVVLAVDTQNHEPNQRQRQHDAQQDRILLEGFGKGSAHRKETGEPAVKFNPRKGSNAPAQCRVLKLPKCPKPSEMAMNSRYPMKSM